MFDLSSLASAKNKAEKNQDKKKEDFDQEYNEALKLLQQFSQDKKQDTLKKASAKLFSAVRCKRSRPEPYIYLAYIFHIFDEKELSIEYLNIAKSLEPNLEQLKELQSVIYSN